MNRDAIKPSKKKYWTYKLDMNNITTDTVGIITQHRREEFREYNRQV